MRRCVCEEVCVYVRRCAVTFAEPTGCHIGKGRRLDVDGHTWLLGDALDVGSVKKVCRGL